MFVRVTNSGPQGNYHYLQLAESFRDPDTGKVKTSLIHNFGSVDKVDFKGIERLIESLKSVLPPSSVKLKMLNLQREMISGGLPYPPLLPSGGQPQRPLSEMISIYSFPPLLITSGTTASWGQPARKGG